MAQNRLIQEMIAQAAILVFTLGACLIGLNWGLEGVSWAVLASTVFGTSYFYILVYRVITTRIIDLVRAITPGLQLSTVLFIVLVLVDSVTGELRTSDPALYLLFMVVPGTLAYLLAFLLLPIPALSSEKARWQKKANGGLRFLYRILT